MGKKTAVRGLLGGQNTPDKVNKNHHVKLRVSKK